MKITKKKLDNIIKEEIQNLLNEKPGEKYMAMLDALRKGQDPFRAGAAKELEYMRNNPFYSSKSETSPMDIRSALNNLKTAIKSKNKDKIEAAVNQADSILYDMDVRHPARKILNQIMNYNTRELSPQAKAGNPSQVDAAMNAIQNPLNEKRDELPSNLIFPALENLKKAIKSKNKDKIEAAIKQADKILRKMTLLTPARKILSQIMDFPSGKLSPQAKVGDSSQVEAVIDAVEMDALNLN